VKMIYHEGHEVLTKDAKGNYLPGSPRASVIKDAAKVCPVAQAARPVFAGLAT